MRFDPEPVYTWGPMATSVQVPVQEYLDGSLEFEPDAEYVDGKIEERPMGEYDHSTWQQAIERWFLQHLGEWDIRVRCALRVQVSPTRFRVPDVVVFRRSQPVEQTLTVAPIAVFEILSPEDRMSRMLVKLHDYEKMGIRSIRVVDPRAQTIYRYTSGALEPLVAEAENLSEEPNCSIDWHEVKRLLDS